MLNVILREGSYDKAFTERRGPQRRRVAAGGAAPSTPGRSPSTPGSRPRTSFRPRGVRPRGSRLRRRRNRSALRRARNAVGIPRLVSRHRLRALAQGGRVVAGRRLLGGPTVPRAQAVDPLPRTARRTVARAGPRAHLRRHAERNARRGDPRRGAGKGPGPVLLRRQPGGRVPRAGCGRSMRCGRLDLLVQIDAFMSQTAVLADYVIAPRMTPEMAGKPSRSRGRPSSSHRVRLPRRLRAVQRPDR